MEVWKDVVNYEGLYQVSNLGRVRSVDRIITDKNGINRLFKGRVLKGNDDGRGYQAVKLYKDKRGTTRKISRLVVAAFMGDIPEGMEVDHINSVRHDNRLENLQILTPSQNTRKAGNHLSKRLLVSYDDGTEQVFRSISELSRDTGIARSTIGRHLDKEGEVPILKQHSILTIQHLDI